MLRVCFRCIWFYSLCFGFSLTPILASIQSVVDRSCWHSALGIHHVWPTWHGILSIPLHQTTLYIPTLDSPPLNKYVPLMSFLLNPSRCALNCILLDYVQLPAPFCQIFYCTESYIHCSYILSHIPQLSVIIIPNGTYTQPGEESQFTEESRSTPWESSGIQEGSKSSLSIKCLLSIMHHAFCYGWLMSPISLLKQDDDTHQKLSDDKSVKPRRVNLVVWHRRRWFDYQQEVQLLGQAHRDKSLQTPTVPLRNNRSGADCIIVRRPLSTFRNAAVAIVPPLLKGQKSTLHNKLSESDHAPSTQVLPLRMSSGDQNVPQPKARADQKVPQHQNATFEVA
jgi:hypothetical protein